MPNIILHQTRSRREFHQQRSKWAGDDGVRHSWRDSCPSTNQNWAKEFHCAICYVYAAQTFDKLELAGEPGHAVIHPNKNVQAGLVLANFRAGVSAGG